MKNKLRLCAILCITLLVFALCGCKGNFHYDGKELVDSAAKLHTSLDAARITVRDDIRGFDAQFIQYRFNGEVMQYMYIGRQERDGGGLTEYYEYNNGTELDRITVPDETKWSFAAKGSKDYYTYSRISRHYFSDGEKLLSDYEAAVKSSVLSPGVSGTRLDLSYDDEKLAQYEALAGVSGYSAYFIFDGEGYCTEYSTAYTLGGEKYSYTVRIEKADPFAEIKRTEPDLPQD